MLDITDTVALLICEVKLCNSYFGNLLVKLYILFVNLRASCQTGKSSNDLIVDKCLNLRFTNLPISQSRQKTKSETIDQSADRPIRLSVNQDQFIS
ncbi:unnamed protein product [marine sediment metagenome]|uniref:Uncharacterized protein n=1 Tax=marine sediment metagenome TaxID=412755 RepID=X1N2R4_9ZZZZ